jgi:hypothetical protein
VTRYFAWDKLEPERQSSVKGHSLSAEQIVGTVQRARPFIGGPIFLVRLAPVDYHHVHYPDHGRTSNHDRLGHRLWTVKWHALLNKQDVLFSNERDVNILETRHFGRIAFVEIGALSRVSLAMRSARHQLRRGRSRYRRHGRPHNTSSCRPHHTCARAITKAAGVTTLTKITDVHIDRLRASQASRTLLRRSHRLRKQNRPGLRRLRSERYPYR